MQTNHSWRTLVPTAILTAMLIGGPGEAVAQQQPVERTPQASESDPVSPGSLNASDFRPRILMRPIRAIVDAPFLAAGEVFDEVNDNELVIGVVVGGKARAYPVNMLTGPNREIINDKLADSRIAATW